MRRRTKTFSGTRSEHTQNAQTLIKSAQIWLRDAESAGRCDDALVLLVGARSRAAQALTQLGSGKAWDTKFFKATQKLLERVDNRINGFMDGPCMRTRGRPD